MSMTTPSHWKVKQSVCLIATGENTPWPGPNIIQERYVNILVQFFPRGPYIVFFSSPSSPLPLPWRKIMLVRKNLSVIY